MTYIPIPSRSTHSWLLNRLKNKTYLMHPFSYPTTKPCFPSQMVSQNTKRQNIQSHTLSVLPTFTAEDRYLLCGLHNKLPYYSMLYNSNRICSSFDPSILLISSLSVRNFPTHSRSTHSRCKITSIHPRSFLPTPFLSWS